MEYKISKRGQVSSFMVMDIMRQANEIEKSGSSVIHFEVGQPSKGIPDSIKENLKTIIDHDDLGYTDSIGNYSLRKNISTFYADYYGIIIDPDSIIITSGSSAGIQLSLLAAFDVGDKIGIISPGYPAYKQLINSLSLIPEIINVDDKSNFEPNVDMIRKIDGLDGLIISSPSNPTGRIISLENMIKIFEYCQRKKIQIISDEIYHGISYGKECISGLAYGNDPIIVNSFSKYFCMTGWRVGWLVVPERLKVSIERLAQNHYISPPAISQIIAEKVLHETDELDKIVDCYKVNRKILFDNLNDIGIKNFSYPDGAFYLYADVSHITQDSNILCKNLLNDAKVALTPGTDFDNKNGKRFIRLSYSCSQEGLVEGLRRIKKWYKKNKK